MRELVILGTAAQVPTRERNHNGYFLYWDAHGFLFDPGEGTQRQMTLADVAASSVSHIALTHFHGDHCLGLPGVIQRLNLDKSQRTVRTCFPASGQCYYDALMNSSTFQSEVEIEAHPLTDAGVIFETDEWTLSALPLEHRRECYGYRLDEKDQRTISMAMLVQLGVELQGPQIGELKRTGSITLDNGQTIRLEDVSTARPGQSFAFVMDTRVCDNAYKLAQGVDLVVCEATYLDTEEKQAWEYMHLTARQAAEIARDAGAKKLVLSHFSQRYLSLSDHLKQAREIFPETYVARDLDRFALPRRSRIITTQRF